MVPHLLLLLYLHRLNQVWTAEARQNLLIPITNQEPDDSDSEEEEDLEPLEPEYGDLDAESRAEARLREARARQRLREARAGAARFRFSQGSDALRGGELSEGSEEFDSLLDSVSDGHLDETSLEHRLRRRAREEPGNGASNRSSLSRAGAIIAGRRRSREQRRREDSDRRSQSIERSPARHAAIQRARERRIARENAAHSRAYREDSNNQEDPETEVPIPITTVDDFIGEDFVADGSETEGVSGSKNDKSPEPSQSSTAAVTPSLRGSPSAFPRRSAASSASPDGRLPSFTLRRSSAANTPSVNPSSPTGSNGGASGANGSRSRSQSASRRRQRVRQAGNPSLQLLALQPTPADLERYLDRARRNAANPPGNLNPNPNRRNRRSSARAQANSNEIQSRNTLGP